MRSTRSRPNGDSQDYQPGPDIPAGAMHAGGAGLLGLHARSGASCQIGRRAGRADPGSGGVGHVDGTARVEPIAGAAAPDRGADYLRPGDHRAIRRRAASAGAGLWADLHDQRRAALRLETMSGPDERRTTKDGTSISVFRLPSETI